jgi:integrase/recombinase XerC
MTELVPFKPGLTPRSYDVERLIERWQEGRSPHTVRAYGRDVAHFARWSEAAAPGEAITRLLTGSMGEANERLHAYRGAMLEASLAPATVNRRLSALRSIVQLGRTFGLVTRSFEIDGVKTKAYRDTAGPGPEGVTAVMRQARASKAEQTWRAYGSAKVDFVTSCEKEHFQRCHVFDLCHYLSAVSALMAGSEKCHSRKPFCAKTITLNKTMRG